MPASRAAESVRPAQGEQIVAAGLFAGEARLEFERIARVILHKAAYYILGSPELSGYPVSSIQWVRATARDFRNQQNFIHAIYFHCGGLDMASGH